MSYVLVVVLLVALARGSAPILPTRHRSRRAARTRRVARLRARRAAFYGQRAA